MGGDTYARDVVASGHGKYESPSTPLFGNMHRVDRREEGTRIERRLRRISARNSAAVSGIDNHTESAERRNARSQTACMRQERSRLVAPAPMPEPNLYVRFDARTCEPRGMQAGYTSHCLVPPSPKENRPKLFEANDRMTEAGGQKSEDPPYRGCSLYYRRLTFAHSRCSQHFRSST